LANNKTTYSKLIKDRALSLGFDFVGFSKARKLDEDAKRLEKWLKEGRHGKMSYMENYFDKRTDPRLLVEGSKTVVSLLYNYHTKLQQTDSEAPKISKYAFGEDYHFVVKEKLKSLFEFVQQEIGAVEGRYFVDSAPVLDRAWARESGLGWIGKNSMLINKQRGSDFFLAELIIDLELEYDSPINDYCGSCTKCIDACPTDAILPERQIAADKCISYLTIELKAEKLPEVFSNKMENWIFGCDICQDVCPWNRFGQEHDEKRFMPSLDLLEMSRKNWMELNQNQFNHLFKNSAVKRTKFSGLKRNLNFIKRDVQSTPE
tara:strand:- start:695 stop:1648 length:954 start_codon:yes stop_codon:yes gene_type:complete